jgi:hypothetical protein
VFAFYYWAQAVVNVLVGELQMMNYYGKWRAKDEDENVLRFSAKI